MADEPRKRPSKRDERLVIPMDPEEAVKALLKADPKAIPPENDKARKLVNTPKNQT